MLFDFIERKVTLSPWQQQQADKGAPFQPHSITSYDAAREIAPTSDNHREAVFQCIVEFGPLTDETIADTLGMNPSTARPRRVELEDAGRIVKRGRLANRSGRMAAAWVVAEPRGT